MIDTVSKRNHTGPGKTPAEAPSDNGHEGLEPKFIILRSFLWQINPWKLIGVCVFAKHGIYGVPLFIVLISILVDVFDKYLILEFFYLMLAP